MGSDKTTLGDRMKMYEGLSQSVLMPKVPVMLRIDGKTFSTMTRKYCEKGFDKNFMDTMVATTIYLMENLQNAKIAYVQSDEISILLWDNASLQTAAWFGNKVQKMVSVSASLATGFFNRNIGIETSEPWFFDSRAWNIPSEEIMNYFIWRQRDWNRNSLSMYARLFYSQKELQKKNREQVNDMLYLKGANWAKDLSEAEKDGTFLYKEVDEFGYKQIMSMSKRILYNDETLNKALLYNLQGMCLVEKE